MGLLDPLLICPLNFQLWPSFNPEAHSISTDIPQFHKPCLKNQSPPLPLLYPRISCCSSLLLMVSHHAPPPPHPAPRIWVQSPGQPDSRSYTSDLLRLAPPSVAGRFITWVTSLCPTWICRGFTALPASGLFSCQLLTGLFLADFSLQTTL